MKVWVTGASGFTGQHLIRQLIEDGHEVTGVYRTEQSSVQHQIGVEVIDLSDARLVKARLDAAKPDQIYHLAGHMPPATSEEMWSAFVRNTYHLLAALRDQQAPIRMLVAGSAAEYLPNDSGVFQETSAVGGLSDYGMSKSAQTMLSLNAAREFGLDIVIARGFNFMGPGMSPDFVVGQICQQLHQGVEELVLGNLDSERDFLDIRDVAAAYRAVMEGAASGDVVNVCSGNSTRIGDIASLACEVFGSEARVLSKARNHGYDIDRAIGDAALLNREIGWQPTISLRQSLEDMKRLAQTTD